MRQTQREQMNYEKITTKRKQIVAWEKDLRGKFTAARRS